MDLNDRLQRLIGSIYPGAEPPHNMYEAMTREIGLSTHFMGKLIEMAIETTEVADDRVSDTKINTLLNLMEVLHSAQCLALKHVSNEIRELKNSKKLNHE